MRAHEFENEKCDHLQTILPVCTCPDGYHCDDNDSPPVTCDTLVTYSWEAYIYRKCVASASELYLASSLLSLWDRERCRMCVRGTRPVLFRNVGFDWPLKYWVMGHGVNRSKICLYEAQQMEHVGVWLSFISNTETWCQQICLCVKLSICKADGAVWRWDGRPPRKHTSS